MHAAIRGFLVVALLLAVGVMDARAQARTIRLAAFGDSLTAGWGVGAGEDFPSVLERELKARGHDVKLINFGVSGDTSAGGVSRVSQVIQARPDAVILELGANDGLRGFDPALTEADLDRILAALGQARIPVLLTGMRALMGMGKRYRDEFAAVFPRLAGKHNVPLYPFFLEGVAGKPELNQPDGLHPNPEGVREIVRRILPDVEKLLNSLS